MYEIDFAHDGCSYIAMVDPDGDGFRLDVYRRFGAFLGGGRHDGGAFVEVDVALAPLAAVLDERIQAREFTRAIA